MTFPSDALISPNPVTCPVGIAAGENSRSIQAQLGHASITTTMDRYGHLLPQTSDGSVKRLDALIFDRNVVPFPAVKKSRFILIAMLGVSERGQPVEKEPDLKGVSYGQLASCRKRQANAQRDGLYRRAGSER